jgi:hypothetical protein
MTPNERDAPPPYVGDYPHGAYWSAVLPEVSVDGDPSSDDGFDVRGTYLKIMWDEGAGPLWGAEGLLPDEPDWLRRALDLSDSLIVDLLEWVRAMDAARERGESQAALGPRALELADRLQSEVGTRFTVRFHP